MNNVGRSSLVGLSLLLASGCSPAGISPVDAGSDGAVADDKPAAVNPFIGSGGFGYAHGSSFPGAAAPQGLMKAGPDTTGIYGTLGFIHFSGYYFGDDTVRGFTHLHLHGTGGTDYGVLSLMPTDGIDAAHTAVDGSNSKFKKETEVATPGYYAVTLDRGKVKAEITAAPHSAQHRYTYPAGASSGFVVADLDHHLESGSITMSQVTLSPADKKVRGVLHSTGGMSRGFGGYDVYFEMRTRQAWKSQVVWTDHGAPTPGTEVSGTGAGFGITFDLSDPASHGIIDVQVGISLTSVDEATANLNAELPGWSFDDVRSGTAAAWTALLDKVTVTGGTSAQRTMLMSAVYHAYLMPSILSDVDGSYRGPDGKTYKADYHHCTDLSLWDTYRTLNPLYSMLTPDRALDVVKSLVDYQRTGGFFPKWPIATGEAGSMLGAGAEIVIADAYVKGVTQFDAMDAYSRLRAAAMEMRDPPGGRGGRDAVVAYMTYGYVPSSKGRAVSLTTEYGNDDFALAQLAAALGKTDDAAALMARRLGYRKLYDPVTGFLWGKNESGAWTSKHNDATLWTPDFAEADAWQSLWMAAHDIDGMVDLLGGQDAFTAKLTDFFEKAKADWDTIAPTDRARKSVPRPYYWAGNEPDIQAAYMFAQAGRPELTQKWVRWALATQFTPDADGLPGNDDGGTMSAWLIFSSIGFFPLPGSDRYVVGAPVFSHVELKVNGGTFTIDAPATSAENLYVQSVTLNGAPLEKAELRHADLKPGGSLVFVMGAAPSTWGHIKVGSH